MRRELTAKTTWPRPLTEHEREFDEQRRTKTMTTETSTSKATDTDYRFEVNGVRLRVFQRDGLATLLYTLLLPDGREVILATQAGYLQRLTS